jgi:hypothetical protein
MKNQALLLLAVSAVLTLLTGCCCKRPVQRPMPAYVETSVDDDLGQSNAYAVEGGILVWHSEAPNYTPFTIHFLKKSPCRKGDNLSGSMVICHTATSGLYTYEILSSDSHKGLVNGSPSYAKIPACTGCSHVPLDNPPGENTPNAGINTPNTSTSTAKLSQKNSSTAPKLVADHLIDTDCDSTSNKPVADGDSPHENPTDSLQAGKTLEWRVVNGADDVTLTITFPNNPPGTGTPCSGNVGDAARPLKALDVCTIDQSAHGDYYYQLNRSDCTVNPSDLIKITVH